MQVPLAVIFYFLTDASNNGDWQVTPNGSGTCVPRPIPPFPFSPRPCSQAARPRRALSLPCESGRRLGNPNLWTQICFQTLVMQFVIFFFNLIPAYTFDMGRVLVDKHEAIAGLRDDIGVVQLRACGAQWCLDMIDRRRCSLRAHVGGRCV